MTKPSTANGGFPNVVVTAVTATTSIAPDIESTWKGLLAGESGIRRLEDDFVEKWDLAAKIGGHLKEPLDPLMSRLEMRRMSYVQRMAKYLGNPLWETAGNPEVDPDRFAVVIGTGLGGGEKIVETYDAMNEGGPRKVSPLAVQMIMPNGAAAVVGLELGPGPASSPRSRRARPVRRASPTRGVRSSWVTPTSPSAVVSRAPSRRCRSRRSR
jgi:beta-ketoacyl ACP synthase